MRLWTETLARAWRAFWRPSARYSLGLLVAAGIGGGIVFWGGFNWAIELTNTEAFCISCHEMRDTVYQEVKETIHYANRTGVRAVCSDCHVPRPWHHKMLRKFEATYKELPHKILGTIGTPEKFEAKRLDLAKSVWAAMKATDSRECRNCHASESMDLEKQLRPAKRRHLQAKEKGQTCIDCHQGIAHKLPKDWVPASGG
jgi:cytochrome c-type protein NapC